MPAAGFSVVCRFSRAIRIWRLGKKLQTTTNAEPEATTVIVPVMVPAVEPNHTYTYTPKICHLVPQWDAIYDR